MFWQAEASAAQPDALAGQGLFIVLSGAVRRRLRRPDGDAKVCRRALVQLRESTSALRWMAEGARARLLLRPLALASAPRW